jgi:hypothetical protein
VLFSNKNNTKNNICNDALDAVIVSYIEGRFPAPLKTNLYIDIFCNDDSKQAVDAASYVTGI